MIENSPTFVGIGRGKKSAQHHAAHLALLDIYREYVELPPGAGPTDGQSGNVLDADGDYKMEESSGRNTNTQFVPTTQGLCRFLSKETAKYDIIGRRRRASILLILKMTDP